MKIRGLYDEQGNIVNLLFKADVQFETVISIIRILSEEENLWDRWDMDNRMKKRSHGKRKGGAVTDPMK